MFRAFNTKIRIEIDMAFSTLLAYIKLSIFKFTWKEFINITIKIIFTIVITSLQREIKEICFNALDKCSIDF